MLKYVDTKNAPAAIGPYSQGIVLNGIAFFSGQIPLSPETGEVVGSDITEQAEQVMKNVGALLESQGASFTDVVKTTCFLADMADFAAFNEVYAKYFTGNPARSCVAVKALPKGVDRRCKRRLIPGGSLWKRKNVSSLPWAGTPSAILCRNR